MPRLTTATAVVVLLSALCRGFDDAASPDVAERPPSSSCGLSSVGAGGSLQLACGFEATVTLTALVPEDGSKSPIHIRPILPEGCALSVSPTRGLVDSASPSVSFTVRAHSSAAPRLSLGFEAVGESCSRSRLDLAAAIAPSARCALAAPRLVLLAPPAYVAVGEAEEFTAMFAGDWPSPSGGVATLQHVALTLSAKAEENGRGAALAPVRLIHRGGACGDGRKDKDDRDEFDCELTREKCAATFSLIGAGRGAVRVVATTQPVWDRPSSGNKIALPERQDGIKQYDATVAIGNDRDQTCAKICTAPGVCTCPPKVRHAVKLQGVPAAALKKRECELLRSAVDGFGKDEEGWKYKPDRTREEREQELDKSLLDLLDGKETKDKETKETKRAGDGLRAALPETLWAEAELSELYKRAVQDGKPVDTEAEHELLETLELHAPALDALRTLYALCLNHREPGSGERVNHYINEIAPLNAKERWAGLKATSTNQKVFGDKLKITGGKAFRLRMDKTSSEVMGEEVEKRYLQCFSDPEVRQQVLPELRAKREECALQMNELAGHSSSAGRDAEPAQAVIRGPPADAGGASADACAGVGGAARAECIEAVCQPKNPPEADCPGGGAARLRVAAARGGGGGGDARPLRRGRAARRAAAHRARARGGTDDHARKRRRRRALPRPQGPAGEDGARRAAHCAARRRCRRPRVEGGARAARRLAPRARAVQSSARRGAAGAQGQLGADGALA